MSGVPETDVELLRCAPPVDITLFPDAQANRIAQDFGRCLPFIYLDIILTAFSFIYGQIRENISKYIFFFRQKRLFKRPVDSGNFWSIAYSIAWSLAQRYGRVFLFESLYIAVWSIQLGCFALLCKCKCIFWSLAI